MIDIIDIRELLKPKLLAEELALYENYLSTRTYSSKKQFIYKINLENENTLQWVSKDSDRTKLQMICKKIVKKLTSFEKFDYERLDELDIVQVLAALGSEGTNNKMFCPNEHSKPTKIQIYASKNICKCHNCNEVMGGPIAVATWKFKGDKKEACEWLSSTFNVSKIDSDGNYRANTSILSSSFKPIKKEIKYMSLDLEKKVVKVNYKDFLEKFEDMEDFQKLKMFATSIWMFSKTTKQWGKENYFRKIGISKKNPLLKEKVQMIEENLGFLFKTDIPKLVKQLTQEFPFEELVRLGVLTEKGQFFQTVTEGLIVIPNFDLYTNMCTSLKYRKTKFKTWLIDGVEKDDRDNKEPEMKFGRIANPLPYHLSREALVDESIEFRFFEGQKDLHSMPSKIGVCDVAIPGINGISKEMLGLFKGRKITLYFDQDKAGQEGAINLKEMLEAAGATVLNKNWDANLGSDVNDVLQSGNILKII